MALHWFKKATVQASLVNAIPAFLTAIIAVVGIYFSYQYYNDQLNQNYFLFKQQTRRDSILNIQQTELTQKQYCLNEKELELVKKQTIQDSINLFFSKIQNESILTKNKIDKINDFLELKVIYYLALDHIKLFFKCDDSIPSIEKVSKNGRTKECTGYLNTPERQNKWANDLILILESGLSNHYLINCKECYRQWNKVLDFTYGLSMGTEFEIEKPRDWDKTFDFDKNFDILWTEQIKLIGIINKEKDRVNKIIEK